MRMWMIDPEAMKTSTIILYIFITTVIISLIAFGINVYAYYAGKWTPLVGQSLVICPLMAWIQWGKYKSSKEIGE